MAQIKNKKLLSAEHTMHLLIAQGTQGINFLADNLCMKVEEKDGNITVIFYKDLTDKLNKWAKNVGIDFSSPINFVADWTNDPTGDRAGAQTSLGYYLFRVSMMGAILLETKPLKLFCKRKVYDSKLVRPQRALYEAPKPGLPIDMNKYPIDMETVEVVKDYIMPKNTWDKAYMVILTKCKKNKTFYSLVSELDFRSFHCVSGVMDFQEYKTEKEANEKHKAFLDKQIKNLKREENYFNMR